MPSVHPEGFLSTTVLSVLLFFRETESVGCIRVPNCVSIVGYYSTIKKKEVLPFAKTWMDLEGMVV